jgi:hypothetical protein
MQTRLAWSPDGEGVDMLDAGDVGSGDINQYLLGRSRDAKIAHAMMSNFGYLV